ncbi:hypothetical protein [Robertkochia flava]|uniref:hypothetical protein n=1 Tax=Robertkochia flava TaxID=3447986 RepID=UPI001CCD8ACF|nr:hypothetical protein [Robertkochia marina]
MKALRIVLTILFISGGLIPVQAQILKKLQKKIEKGLEKTVIDKTNEKVQHEAGKAMEQMLEGDFMNQNPMMSRGEMADMSDVAETYGFSYVYTLEMKDDTQNEATTMDMYLEPDAGYWGMQMKQAEQMTMVHDADKNLMVMFMDQDGQKMAMAFKTDLSEMNEEDMEASPFEVREIAGKEILGYDCQGFEVETPEYLVTVYNTFDAEVTMANVFGVNEDLPANFDPEWVRKDGKYGLMMEMHMKDKTGDSNDLSMRCVALKEASNTISKKEYQSVTMPSGKQ